MIKVEDVIKTYDTVTAVDGVSFATEPGEIFGLIGPNGAGKTTIIRMIMNIIYTLATKQMTTRCQCFC